MFVTLAIVLFIIAFCFDALFGKGEKNDKGLKF